MIADNHQALIFIFSIPALQIWHDMLAVNAIERPHLQPDYFATQLSEAQRRSSRLVL
jgi:hypothetical protein